MPRYFFHTEDGESFEDTEGTELTDLETAKRQAAGFLAELLRGNSDALWHTGDFSVIVTDADKLVLFRIDVTGTVSPVAEPDKLARQR